MADPMTRHVVVATEAHTGVLRAPGELVADVPKGYVQKLLLTCQTHIADGITGIGLKDGRGKIVRAFIEHPTAEVGDVLPDSELTPALEIAAKKLADMHERRKVAQAAQAATQAKEAEEPPLTAADRKALRALLTPKANG